MFFKSSHALRHVVVWECTALSVMVVHIAHTELRLESHGTGEELHQLSENVLVIWLGGVVHKHHSVCVFLNGWPALFIAEVSRNVPKFEVKLAERCHRRRRIPLQVHNPK